MAFNIVDATCGRYITDADLRAKLCAIAHKVLADPEVTTNAAILDKWKAALRIYVRIIMESAMIGQPDIQALDTFVKSIGPGGIDDPRRRLSDPTILEKFPHSCPVLTALQLEETA